MSKTPYTGLPDHCFWRKAHDVDDLTEIDPVVRPAFTIGQRERIATAGSCFAQHLARHLASSGYNYFVSEKPHPLVADVAEGYNYGVFSARYGNIYTAAQLRQLYDRATGLFEPKDDVWEGADGRFYDPFRPAIQPDGFASRAEFEADRSQHFAAVRRIFRLADVFIFTLGLTEAWRSKEDGAVYPLCPGVAAGTFDPDRHEFVNFNVSEVVRDVRYVIRRARQHNPAMKVILTVSPVPLIATALDRSVIQSTVYSKSVLRVAAEMVSESLPDVAYFPSYEVITGPGARGRYFADDCREVRPEGVAHVMKLFMRHYGSEEVAEPAAGDERKPRPRKAPAPAKRPARARFDAEAMEAEMNVVCDEEIIAAKRALEEAG